MSGFSVSAVLAVFFGLLLLPLLFVPYLAWSYRRRGTLGYGHAIIAAGAVIYGMALWTHTIVPLPDPETVQCTTAQLRPLASLGDLDLAANGLRDPALLQLILNVALFVPFGMLVRHLTGARARWVVAAAFALSLLIELTQLTGVWGLYPCSYRLFDVDDLLTNTLGAALGVTAAPLLRRVPGQDVLPTDAPREVTRGRRLVGMAADVVSVHVVGFLVYLPLAIAARDAGWFGEEVPYSRLAGAATLAVAVLMLGVLPRFTRGATLGQLITSIRPVTTDGQAPGGLAMTVRFAAGSGGYFALDALGDLLGLEALTALSTLWIVLSGAAVLLGHPRGLSGRAAGLTVVDTRSRDLQTGRAREADPRSLGQAVVALVATVVVIGTAMSALGSLSPAIELGVAAVGVLALAVASLAVLPYLVGTGLLTVRREGLGVATALPLLTAGAIVGLLSLTVVAIVTHTRWLVALTVGGMAVTGYLGLLFLAFLAYGQWYARRTPTWPADAVVVLGSRVFGERVPPLLAARIDRGMEALDEILASDPDAPTVLVCSGGQGPDETVAEGTAMAAYAVRAGAPADRVIAETASRTTEENLLRTRELLHERGLGASMVVATNDFHAFRAAIISRELGIEAQVVGARTAHYYFPAAILREFVGVLARSPLVHASVGLLLGALVGAAGYLLTG